MNRGQRNVQSKLSRRQKTGWKRTPLLKLLGLLALSNAGPVIPSALAAVNPNLSAAHHLLCPSDLRMFARRHFLLPLFLIRRDSGTVILMARSLPSCPPVAKDDPKVADKAEILNYISLLRTHFCYNFITFFCFLRNIMFS